MALAALKHEKLNDRKVQRRNTHCGPMFPIKVLMDQTGSRAAPGSVLQEERQLLARIKREQMDTQRQEWLKTVDSKHTQRVRAKRERAWMGIAHLVASCSCMHTHIRLMAQNVERRTLAREFRQLALAQLARQHHEEMVSKVATFQARIGQRVMNFMLFHLRCARRRLAGNTVGAFFRQYGRPAAVFVLAVERFHTKVVFIQRWTRGFLACKAARVTVLSLMWDQIGGAVVKVLKTRELEKKYATNGDEVKPLSIHERYTQAVVEAAERELSAKRKFERKHGSFLAVLQHTTETIAKVNLLAMQPNFREDVKNAEARETALLLVSGSKAGMLAEYLHNWRKRHVRGNLEGHRKALAAHEMGVKMREFHEELDHPLDHHHVHSQMIARGVQHYATPQDIPLNTPQWPAFFSHTMARADREFKRLVAEEVSTAFEMWGQRSLDGPSGRPRTGSPTKRGRLAGRPLSPMKDMHRRACSSPIHPGPG